MALHDSSSRGEIRSRSCPNCYLCGSEGELLYEGLKDWLYGAPGTWNFKLCSKPACGLLWFDPMPLYEDIEKAYVSYYTHQAPLPNGSRQTRRGFVGRILHKSFYLVLKATLIHLERRRLDLMYVGSLSPGKLLDVGCGGGSRLGQLRALGWDVQGQEVDPKAAAQARNIYGVPVYLGRLEDAAFPDASFDAILMSHVIEHVHDPVRLLAECIRVLKRGGTLVVVTPNAESYGHKRFGSYWRGLEPPRHLYLFSQGTLRAIAAEAGFVKCDTWTSAANASGYALGSFENKASALGELAGVAGLDRRIWAAAYQFSMSLAHRANPRAGEECCLKATR